MLETDPENTVDMEAPCNSLICVKVHCFDQTVDVFTFLRIVDENYAMYIQKSRCYNSDTISNNFSLRTSKIIV